MPKKDTKTAKAIVEPKPKLDKKSSSKKVSTPKIQKPPKKPAKKAMARKRVVAHKITKADFEKWFFKLSVPEFVKVTQQWNEENLKIKITKQQDYDAWFNYFKDIPASQLRLLSSTGQDFLGGEAYSALRRWLDIITNPHRIDKVHQTGLSNAKGKGKNKTIAQLALDNDRLGVLKATRDKLAEKLDKGAGSRDTSLLVREMTEVMTQIADYEKRLGPKKETMLGNLLADMPIGPPTKRTRTSGARNTSYAAKVTIDDVEGR